MNVLRTLTLSVLVVWCLPACQRPFLSDDDATTRANWESVDFESERLIIGAHATPFEGQVITENQFARFDGNNKVLEIRPLSRNQGVLGIPVLSDNTFMRLTTNEDAKQVVEFHLSRNPAEIHTVLVEDLAGPTDGFMEVETFSRSLGAFSADGAVFMLPVKVLPDQHYALLLFEIRHNLAHTSFTSVELVKRINLFDLSSDLSKLNSMRFLNGNFYVTSQEGAWRISPSGEVEKIFTQWMIDVFAWQGDLYITGLNSFDLHKSTDNGRTWERLNQDAALKWVTNVNQTLFTQDATGLVFQVAEEGFLEAKNIVLPEGHSPQEANYYGAFFFAERFYFTMDRKVYRTEALVTE